MGNLTNILPLKAPVSLTGSSSAIVNSQASVTAIEKVQINITPTHPTNGIVVTLKYGNVINGDFVPVALHPEYSTQDVFISNEDFQLLSDTTLTQAEKSMTPFLIIQMRIFKFLYAKGFVTLG